ncbi:MAG: SDR family oxidoreductase, partial [Proteobacteria bacterium]|nr:SDR family oxidoreductase [Pseudomonadota bacterium]
MSKTGQIVLVTGASSGIGRAIALHLAAKGHRVFGASRGATEVPGVEAIAMDVDDEASVQAAVARVLNAAGRLDAVINNAGVALRGAVEDTRIEEAKALFETNFFGVLRVCRAVLPAMRQQRGGLIVNVSSLAGVFGSPFSGLYSASKFAVEGMSEALRLEVARFGIRVVLVEPGDHDSALPARRATVADARSNLAYAEAFARSNARQARDEAHAAKPEKVARLVVRLLDMRDPKMRYTVGRRDQRMVAPLKRFLPSRLYERILRGALG